MLKHGPYQKSLWLIACLLLVSLTTAAILSQRLRRLFAPTPSSVENRMNAFPRVILWAWERPVALDFIDTREVGVAFLAKTIFLRGEITSKRPRLQPLSVPQGTMLIAVARIESDRREPPRLTSEQLAQTASEIAELASLPGIAAIQVDFDAKLSERDFYRSLLFELRHRLPQQLPLSITALASWCTHDDWLTGLPVDEAVPMLFRMGLDQRQVVSYLATGAEFRQALCRDSAGIATDETLLALPSARRFYVFSTQDWSPVNVRHMIERSKK
ncbi:MAG TPA: hypothetical protein VGO91_12455 [Pyrinomonadaceae bacterium]|jgi:hypothetical protein|nr:hypothetical protein [Pyrinomonadaceae bacterium]